MAPLQKISVIFYLEETCQLGIIHYVEVKIVYARNINFYYELFKKNPWCMMFSERYTT